MKKIIFLFLLISASVVISKAQVTDCNSFCILNVSIDSVNHQLHVTVYNGNDTTTQVNFPIVQVTNTLGDTIANIDGLAYYFEQFGGDTVVHILPTTLINLPLTGFVGTVYVTDGLTDSTCTFAYPTACTVGVKEMLATTSLNIYPNPATNDIHFDLGKLNNHQALINLYDTEGRLVKRYATASNHLVIDREGLINGIYFVTVDVNNKRITSKLVIQ